MGGNGKREAGKVNLEWCPEKGGWAIQVVWFVVILENYKRQARSTNTSFYVTNIKIKCLILM